MMPTIDRFRSYRFFFYSNEGVEPAHIHVESDEKWAKFWLEPVELEDSDGFNRSELTKMRKLVQERRQKFVERWNEHFNR